MFPKQKIKIFQKTELSETEVVIYLTEFKMSHKDDPSCQRNNA